MKNIIIYIFAIIGYTLNTITYAESLRDNLTNVVKVIIPDASSGSKKISYASIAEEIQKWMFVLVGIIAVIYIVWAGAKLLWSPGNTEEV